MPVRILLPVLAAAFLGCGVDTIEIGDPCTRPGAGFCRSDQLSFYCVDGHWFETDCWAACLETSYDAGYCGKHSRFGDGVCFCTPAHTLRAGVACHHEGDQQCRYQTTDDKMLLICADGAIREMDCAAACGGNPHAICSYDPVRGDDSCICEPSAAL